MAFGGLLALMAVFGAIVLFAARSIHGDLKDIAHIAQPISAASFEMEINTIGAGFGVVKYLHKPRPEFRARFEKDKADFERFLTHYRRVVTDEHHLALADTLGTAFREFNELGDSLMALRDALTVSRKEYAEIAEEFDRFDDAYPMSDDKSFIGQPLTNSRLVLALASDMAEIFLYMASNAWETKTADARSREEHVKWFEGEIANARDSLRQLSDVFSTPEEAKWLDQFSENFERAVALTREIIATETAIDRDLVLFIDLRQRIDDILDDQIQVWAGIGLSAANTEAEANIEHTYWFLAALGVLSILIAGAAVWILSRTIVRPIRQLSVVARRISTGNLTFRANIDGGGELGELGRAFDHMTESLESARNKLNRSNADLEEQVAARTSALSATNRQLEDELAMRAQREYALHMAKEAAEIANRGKTVFLANMSHELRTPLNAVIGFANMINMELLGPVGNETYKGYIKDIQESSQHLLHLINDILDLSKIETGNVKLKEEWVAISHLTGKCADLIRWRVREKGLLLSVDVAPGLPDMWVDELRMKQILINLLDNAIKFTPQGGEIALSAALAANGDLEIAVRDTGIGIAPENHGKVMAVFSQVDADLDRSYEGAGLGLALVKAFAELHDGALTLESALGKGTRITIALPQARLQTARKTAEL